MSEPNPRNAEMFYKAWKGISRYANEAHREYLVARDVASTISKPKVPDFPGSKDVMRAAFHLHFYNAIQTRVRFYRERWHRLNKASEAAYAAWKETVKDD
jgi:hypothetical protein